MIYSFSKLCFAFVTVVNEIVLFFIKIYTVFQLCTIGLIFGLFHCMLGWNSAQGRLCKSITRAFNIFGPTPFFKPGFDFWRALWPEKWYAKNIWFSIDYRILVKHEIGITLVFVFWYLRYKYCTGWLWQLERVSYERADSIEKIVHFSVRSSTL